MSDKYDFLLSLFDGDWYEIREIYGSRWMGWTALTHVCLLRVNNDRFVKWWDNRYFFFLIFEKFDLWRIIFGWILMKMSVDGNLYSPVDRFANWSLFIVFWKFIYTRVHWFLFFFYLRMKINQGGYCTGPRLAEFIRESILTLCSQVKPEAVAIADSLAPPDFVLNSVLGMSDGRVSKFLSIRYFSIFIGSRPLNLIDFTPFFVAGLRASGRSIPMQ